MRRKSDCGFDLYFVKHVLEFLILIYVSYKSGVYLNSYGLLSYSHVLICFSMDKWVLCGHFYSYVDRCGRCIILGQVPCNCTCCILGRAPRTKETLPDFR